jgi:Flp pilus assembly protein TadG
MPSNEMPSNQAPRRAPRRRREGEEGVIVILFAMSLVVLLGFAGLVYTGAQALVLRRQLQNGGDAGALAAANLLIVKNGCSDSGSGGAPRDTVIAAAKAAVTQNLPSYSAGDITVTCPADYNNFAVQVALHESGPSYFGMAAIPVATSSVAVNGRTTEHQYAVVLLDPMNAGWPSQRNGCASFLVNGGIQLTFEKSVFVNSQCTVAYNNSGAVKALNSSFRMTLVNGAVMRIAGEMALNTVGKITPNPTEHFSPLVPDPLAGMLTPDQQSGVTLPTMNMSTICATQNPCILSPGRYPGGIAAGGGGGPSTVLLRPGVYYLAGGGMKLKSASARILSLPTAATMADSVALTTFATTKTADQVGLAWQAACPLGNSPCGVMIYNAPVSSTAWATSGGNADQISNGSQGMLMLRAYKPENDSTPGAGVAYEAYRNLVFWQARTPKPTQATGQPDISMSGGACVAVSGTVYAPGGKMDFGGSSCGTGGGGDAVSALQFIVYDLTISGNNNFYFAYQKDYFAAPQVYGLIK